MPQKQPIPITDIQPIDVGDTEAAHTPNKGMLESIFGQGGAIDQLGAPGGLVKKIQDWIDQKLAPDTSAPTNTGNNIIDGLAGVGKDVIDFGRGAVRTITAPIRHPLDTIDSLNKTADATGLSSLIGGGNSSPVPTPDDAARTVGAAKDLTGQIKQSFQTNPVDAAGSLIGPSLVGEGFGAAKEAAVAPIRAAGGIQPFARGLITDALVPGSPEELLTRALKPSVNVPEPTAILKRTLPDVIKSADNRPTSVAQYGQAADRARSYNQAGYQGALNGLRQDGSPVSSAPVSTSPIADAIRGSISPAHQFEAPISGALDSLATKAEFYDNNMAPLGTMDNLRSTYNAKLDSIFAESPADRSTTLRANPAAAATMATRNALADSTYSALDAETGIPIDAIRENRTAYGDLRDTSDIANKRATVYGRANPVSLSEEIAAGGAGGIRGYLFNRILKGATGSDALVDAATRRYLADNPEGSGLPTPQRGVSGPGKPRPPIAGLLPAETDNTIDADTVPLNYQGLNAEKDYGWSANTTGTGMYPGYQQGKPPIGYDGYSGYPVPDPTITPAPRPTLQLQSPSNDFQLPTKRGPIQLRSGPQPNLDLIGPGSSQPRNPGFQGDLNWPASRKPANPDALPIMNPQSHIDLVDKIKARESEPADVINSRTPPKEHLPIEDVEPLPQIGSISKRDLRDAAENVSINDNQSQKAFADKFKEYLSAQPKEYQDAFQKKFKGGIPDMDELDAFDQSQGAKK